MSFHVYQHETSFSHMRTTLLLCRYIIIVKLCCCSTLKCYLIFIMPIMFRINVICVLVICHMGTGMHTLFIYILLSKPMGYFLSVRFIVNIIVNLKRTKLK